WVAKGRRAGRKRRLRWRGVAFAALFGLLLAYYELSASGPNVSTWWDVAWLAVVLIPSVFLLVWLVLPLQHARGLLATALAFALLAFLLHRGDFEVTANFCKLAAVTGLAFWFLGYFETVAWVVVVALIIPWIDAYSVWRGPTHHIVTQRREIFSAL